MSDSILKLSTKEKAPIVEIDGTAYELRVKLEASQILDLKDLFEEYSELYSKPSFREAEKIAAELDEEPVGYRTPEDSARVEQIAHDITSAVLNAPVEVIDSLDFVFKAAIMSAAMREINTRMDPTGIVTASRPGSADSMESETG